MSKASETKLSTLHGKVAEVLTAQLDHTEAETIFDEDGNSMETGERVHTASPATIAAAIKFLKDNQITCDIEQSENMNNLRESLSKKQKHSRLSDAKQSALRLVGE
jgi:hypothetical protein